MDINGFLLHGANGNSTPVICTLNDLCFSDVTVKFVQLAAENGLLIEIGFTFLVLPFWYQLTRLVPIKSRGHKKF